MTGWIVTNYESKKFFDPHFCRALHFCLSKKR